GAVLELFRGVPVKALWLENISTQDIQELAEHLPPILQQLDLNGTDMGEAGVRFLAPYLPATLQRLSLSSNDMGDAGVTVLASHLPLSLQQITLRRNDIGDAGVGALVKHLPLSLQKLDLYNNSIGAAGVKVLAAHLAKFQNLRQLDLRYNDIGEAGVRVLMAHLPSTLRELCLDGKNIKNEALGAFLEAVPKTGLSNLFISIPVESPLRDPFKNLRNRHNVLVTVEFL
ncbi:MAG: hypothetical protein ACRC4G_04295, partial [Alphaproteobacteria bacterium]